ncbi:hypothetical protein QL285_048405 [Trifolium repens]|nr:hypothetical protein QL285_048405 [Trifolium repens]
MIALTILCFASVVSQKGVIPSVSGPEMSPSNIFHKRVIPSVSGPEMSSSNIFQVAYFANNPFANLHLVSPKRSPPVCLITDKYFSLLCPALLQ